MNKFACIFSLILSLFANSFCIKAQTDAAAYRFHCSADTTQISEMLSKLQCFKNDKIGKIVCHAADLLLNKPYAAATLEAEQELLVINVDQLDCVTFVETCFALAKTIKSGSSSWRSFARNIENIRYRAGKRDGYASRLHYTTDWFNDNIYRHNISDVTTSIPCQRSLTKTLNFMTTHRNEYPALQVDSIYEKCRTLEMGFHSMRIPYIPKSAAAQKDVVEYLQDGDMISFLSKTDGLDSSHVALIRIVDGKPYMMHASLKAGKVIFEKEPLFNYFKYIKRDSPGFRVVRLL